MNKSKATTEAPVDILKAARDIIARPESWIKGTYATTERDIPVRPGNSNACRYCSIGAILRAHHDVGRPLDPFHTDVVAVTNRLHAVVANEHFSIWAFNDAKTTTHADVLAVFDEAIKRAEAEQ